MNNTGTRQDHLLYHPEAIVLVQPDVFFILGIQVARKVLVVQPPEHGGDQPACNPLSLVRGINPDKKR